MKIISLIASLVIAYSAAFIGTLFTAPAIDTWYATLVRPPLNPPDWVFGPVWTVLYAGMAVAAWRVYEKGEPGPKRSFALFLYGVQLVLNALWSVVFFGLKDPSSSLIVILLLLVHILGITYFFFKLDRVAGWLFVPYLAWVSFATYLNIGIVFLN